MKRWIHANTISETVKKISDARKKLEKYSDEQIKYVRECQDEISKAISENYAREEDGLDERINLSSIKRDYLAGAVEDDLMTEEEFDEIFDMLDIIGLELSAPYA